LVVLTIVPEVPKPLSELEKIPAVLRKPHYILKHDPNTSIESPVDDAPSLTFTLNTTYAVDADGRRRVRGVEREAINLNRAQEEQEAIENALNAEPDPQIKAALAEWKQLIKPMLRSRLPRDNIWRDKMIWLIKLRRNLSRSRMPRSRRFPATT
jgi:hypothetical protein